MIKAVIFDWGGVVAPNPHGGWLNLLADMLTVTIDEILPHWHAAGYEAFSKGIIDETTFWAQFEQSLGKPLPNEKERIWIEGTALQPWPQVLSLINNLQEKGLINAVLSNVVRPVSMMLQQAGLYDQFDCVVLSDQVGLVKPDTTIYQLTLDKLGLKAEECLYIDDLAKNLIPAANLGMVTILASDDLDKTVTDIRLSLMPR